MFDSVAHKQQQFNAAMKKYETQAAYLWVGRMVSFVNVSLQIVLAVLVVPQSIGFFNQVLTFVVAYILVDFVNGWVHLYMDNNEDYESLVGPLVAAFHLHHRTPVYKVNPLYLVYYHESGSKLWLAGFELIAVLGVGLGVVTGVFAYGVLYFAVLSSVAEVSHYLCHTPQSALARMLGHTGLLLSKRYHLQHHTQDNVQYAFLNGMTDPLLNVMAKVLYSGYKNNTDLHYATYSGIDTENR